MERTYKGNGIVWDPTKDKTLCRFVDGEYTTSDPHEIEVLNKALKIVDEPEEVMTSKPKVTPELCKKLGEATEYKLDKKEFTKKEAMDSLDILGIPYNPRDKKEKLIKLLEA